MEIEKRWLVVRLLKRQWERKAQETLEEMGIDVYAPFREEGPLIPGMIFVHYAQKELQELIAGRSLPLFLLNDRTTGQAMVIPDKQMADFMYVTELTGRYSDIQVYDDKLMPGKKVRVTEGQFAGIEGELIRIQGHKRVVIRLPGLLSLATTYIPREFIQPLEE